MILKTNILEFCLSPDLGGLELCVLDSFEYFKDKSSTTLVVLEDSKLDKYLEDSDKLTLKKHLLSKISFAIQLARIINNKEIDIIHFHWTKDMPIVVLAKKLSKRNPKIIQSRHMHITRFKDDFYHKWLYKNIDTIHAVTNQVKEELIKYIPENVRPSIEVVYLGTKEKQIDMKKVENLKEKYKLGNSFIIGIVGRIEPAKGQYLLIEAVSKLKKYDCIVLVVGAAMNEAYLLELKEKIKALNIEDKVIFTGFTQEVDEHFSLCDASVLATENETFGLVLIESMSNQVCSLAVKNGGPLEIIEDNETGILFDRDSLSLSQKLELVLKDNDLKNKVALDGYKSVRKRFDFDTQMESLHKLVISLYK